MALRYLAASASALFLLWFAASLWLFCLMSTPVPPAVDAVVVLGGISDERLPVGQALAAGQSAAQSGAGHGGPPVLVLSRTDSAANSAADSLCKETPFPQEALVCFRPEGMDTRGEAAAVGKLVAANGWRSVAVVTSSYHVLRAGTLIRQCTAAEVSMVASKPTMDSLRWLRRFAIESAGLVDVLLRPECG